MELLVVKNHLKSTSEISRTIANVTKAIENTPLKKILLCNKYEKIVPFNLWYRHDSYVICNNVEHNQNMRIRYFNSMVLTPLVSHDNYNLSNLRSFIDKMSLYQPFYPETFFAIYEFLQMKHLAISNPAKSFLNISMEERLGSIEAIIFYHERYQHTYQYNTYDTWLVGNESYNLIDDTYNLSMPTINYLAQAYKINFIRSTSLLQMYDFINIDCIHMLDDIFEWKNEEMDLQATIFYVITSLKHLKHNGSMLIRLNIIGGKSWEILFDTIKTYFKEHALYRSSIVHPFNSEIYLFLDKFNSKMFVPTIHNIFLKNLYIQKIYTMFNLNHESKTSINALYSKYLDAQLKWIKQVKSALTSVLCDIPGSSNMMSNNMIDQWHASNELAQIKDLVRDFPDFSKSIRYDFITYNCKYNLKPIPPTVLYDQSFYKNLIEKRACLNYYKRVMDTKPSQIFSQIKNNRKKHLLLWENINFALDITKDIKNILKKNYNAEMVTNAWIKMYSMLNMFDDLLPNNPHCPIKTFHLCEAPGAFISATNHFVSNRNQTLQWYAQTLKPAKDGNNSGSNAAFALQDHFGLISKHPERWLFGDKPNDTGDITDSAIIKSYVNNDLLHDIDFMTADAGLYCDPSEINEQEAFLGKINMGQIICILACLPVGKSAIFKTFLPMSEPLTISMIYLVVHLFEKVSITKPSTSHSTNSEVYIVMRRYKGIDSKILELLYTLLDDPAITSKTLLFNKMDNKFFAIYLDIINKLIDRQIKSLCHNYYYYYNYNQINSVRSKIETGKGYWLRDNPINNLDNYLLS